MTTFMITTQKKQTAWIQNFQTKQVDYTLKNLKKTVNKDYYYYYDPFSFCNNLHTGNTNYVEYLRKNNSFHH